MDKILIFSGTSEGRELSEFLTGKKIGHTVYVATEYGEIVMDKSSYCNIVTGRLDAKAMEELFLDKTPKLVVDATHPYAIEVSKNIKEACEKCNIADKYIRVSRELPLTEQLLREDYKDIEVVLSTEDAIEYLKGTSGNILLTTGVKTLSQYCDSRELKDRIVARILPSKESLSMAYDAGLSPHQIIAMEGPFLASMNAATIEQYNIKTIVTKNSGIKGGFIEKLEAASNKGVKALVIDIEKKCQGISVDEAKAILEKLEPKKKKEKKAPKKVISIVGIGAGNETTMTVAAVAEIRTATLLIGAERMLEIGRTINSTAKTVNAYMPDKVMEAITENDDTKIAFLVSGDTGFYSGATALKEALKYSRIDYIVKILPGISSVAYFASLIGISYSNAAVVSTHGKECNIGDAMEKNDKLFAIVSGYEDVNVISKLAGRCKKHAHIYVGYNLGLEDEEIIDFSKEEPIFVDKKGLYVVGVIQYE